MEVFLLLLVVFLVFADRLNWGALRGKNHESGELGTNDEAILISIRNLNQKLDELEKHPDDWQTAAVFVTAWPVWMQRYDVENVTNAQVPQVVNKARRRMLRLLKVYESIPIEVRKPFVAENQNVQFSLERWETNESNR